MHLKCERLSAETGCWLYVSGQHVNANMGFYSYASPRFRRESKEEVINIQNSFAKAYAALLNARRLDAIKLSIQAENYKADLKKAQEEIAEKAAHIARLQSELERST
jgi:hypothetical protein